MEVIEAKTFQEDSESLCSTYEASIEHIIKDCGLRDKMKPIAHTKGLI